MGNKKVIIIGGGPAGLCAGCYLQMNGYDTEIFEMHDRVGGCCSSWERKGYIFDGCIHFLVGSGESNAYYSLWNELIDMQGMEIIDFEDFVQIEKGGISFTLFADPDKLKEEMIRIAPEDKVIIGEFTNALKEYQKVKLSVDKAPETLGIIGLFGLLKTMRPYLKLNKKWNITMKDFLSRFNSQFFKDVFPDSFDGEDRSLLMILTPLSTMSTKGAGYPIGGSLKFAQKIEESYLSLGGKISFNKKIKKIIVDNNKAKGIILDNGEEHFGDIIISASDGYNTIYEMLEGKYLNKQIAEFYKSRELFGTMVRVSLGVNRTFEDTPHMYSLYIDEPIVFEENRKIDRLETTIYNFDPTLAPKGKTSVVVAIMTQNDEYWTNLRNKDRKKYNAEKDRIAEEVIDRLDKYFGDFKSKVEVIDVATPATYIRYTNNWKGRFMAWALTPKSFKTLMKKTLPGLENFYLISQWSAFGGGVTTGLDQGRNVTQIICKEDKKKFVTS